MASEIIFNEGVAPSSPGSNKASLFLDTSNRLCYMDESGVVYILATLEKSQTFSGTTIINKFAYGIGATLTIASGIITVTHNIHTIDTEAAGATDDLVTINGGVAGMEIIIGTASSARDVVLKHGTGNILLDGGADFTLAFTRYRCKLVYDGSNWIEVGRSD